MPEKIDFWVKVTGGTLGLLTTMSAGSLAVMKGIFLTRREHNLQCKDQNEIILKAIEDMKGDLKAGSEAFKAIETKLANTEKYLGAIAVKINLKSDELPKL